VTPSAANFLLVHFSIGSLQVYEALLQDGVITRSVAAYDIPNALRISVGDEEGNKALVAALKKIL
jgi:histidinol-phosphate aminotransferase